MSSPDEFTTINWNDVSFEWAEAVKDWTKITLSYVQTTDSLT